MEMLHLVIIYLFLLNFHLEYLAATLEINIEAS